MTPGRTLAALYRKTAYSPNQHRVNDAAILDATVESLAERGWRVRPCDEAEVERGHVPVADLYLNMCQGPAASELLVPVEADGARIVNRATSVLNCHRHRMIRKLLGLAFPFSLIISTDIDAACLEDKLDPHFDRRAQLWVKRGDVHAQQSGDVVRVPFAELASAIAAFAQRAIPWVVLQEHVAGPVVKFYGVSGGRFFRWYYCETGRPDLSLAGDGSTLRELAYQAADLLGLEVFGGDAVFPQQGGPVLIDINDWPSFAPFREEAALAIADYVDEKARGG